MNLKKVADSADMIVNGYAFTKKDDMVQVLNLYGDNLSAVLNNKGAMVSTNMDSIELKIVQDIYKKDKKYMKV